MVKSKYIPNRGDVVWLDFFPAKGHEQEGRRPAVVLSHLEYNNKSTLALFCPITSKTKKYPFEVEIKRSLVKGVVLADQIKHFDWSKRNLEFICELDEEVFDEVVQKTLILIK